VWSPGGKRILLLAGAGEVDKPAPDLWLVDAAAGQAKVLPAPAAGLRYLAAAWIDDDSFVAVTAKWESDQAQEGTEQVWRSAAATIAWKEVKVPAPSAERTPRRLPVVIRTVSEPALVYATGSFAAVAAGLDSGKTLLTLDPAEVVGPGPGGGFLAARPIAENTAEMEIAAFGADLKVLWRRSFPDLQKAIAARLGKEPSAVAFNETSTTELPPAAETGWLGLTLVSTSPGWRDGITGYHLRLDAATGDVLAAVTGVALSGRPAGARETIWAVLAPDARSGAPVRLQNLAAVTGKTAAEIQLADVSREDVHGYALDPSGKFFALALGGSSPQLRIYEAGKLDRPRVVALAPAK
jgi:hypothetical protein